MKIAKRIVALLLCILGCYINLCVSREVFPTTEFTIYCIGVINGGVVASMW